MHRLRRSSIITCVLLVWAAILSACFRPEVAAVPYYVTRIPTDGTYTQLALSPDSSRVLATGFPAPPGDETFIYLIDLASGEETQLPLDSGRYEFPRWSPEGERFSIMTGFQVSIVDLGAFSQRAIFQGDGATWSRNGEDILAYRGPAFGGGRYQRSLSIIDSTGSVLHAAPIALPAESQLRSTLSVGAPAPTLPTLMDIPTEWLLGIAWSPDRGTALISIEASYGHTNVNEALMVDVLTGSSILYAPGSAIGRVDWSPDGRVIAYLELVETSLRGQLVLADRLGKCLASPEVLPEVQDVSWADDSSTLAFLLNGELMMLDVQEAIQRSARLGLCN